jgi:hypothetical protein
MPTSDLRLNDSLDNIRGLSVDDSGYAKMMRMYGAQGFSVSCVHPTTTIIGSEGSLILENLGRGKYSVSIVDANDTARVPVSKDYLKKLPDLSNECRIRDLLFNVLGSDDYFKLFDNEPRKRLYEKVQWSDENEKPSASFWTDVNRKDGKMDGIGFSYVVENFNLDFNFDVNSNKARGGDGYQHGGVLIFKGNDETGGEGFWGAIYDGSRIVPLTKRLVVEGRNPSVFQLIYENQKRSASEIETRFGSWINKNPVLYDRAKHIIECLEGPALSDDHSLQDKYKEFIKKGRLDFSDKKISSMKRLDLLESVANVFGLDFDRDDKYRSPSFVGLYGRKGPEYCHTEITFKKSGEEGSYVSFSTVANNLSNGFGFMSNGFENKELVTLFHAINIEYDRLYGNHETGIELEN